MPRNWKLAIALLANLACPAWAAQNELFTAAEQQWIQEHPVVRYSIDPYWPIEYLQDGQHRGLTREYIDHVARVSGLRFELVPSADWAQTLERLGEGTLEVSSAISAHLLDQDARSKLLASEPYFVDASVVITRASEAILYSPSKLNGKTIAVKGGGGYERYLRKNYPRVRLLPINSSDLALDAVAEGKADAAVGLDRVLLPTMRRRYGNTLHISGVLADMPVVLAMGVTPSQPMLLGIIDKSLGTLTSEMTDAMEARWISSTDFGAPSWGSILRYYALETGAVVLGLLLLIGLARRATLARRAAQASEADKSAFLAMMSHEIRTPMNAILASIELLRRTRLDARQQDLAELANSSATNLLELLDDVLDISKLDAGKVELDAQPTDLNKLVSTVVDAHRLSLHEVKMSLTCIGLEHRAVMIDRVRLRQVLSNLLSNAVKFTERGRIEVRLELEALDLHQGQLKLAVSDTGIGIAPARQARLFQAFVQADQSTTRRYGGSGLGLSICKQLVELMGGEIRLQSTLGEGTTVSAWLPVVLAEVPVEQAARPERLARTDRRPRVLVVEDHPVNQQALELQLEALGYRSQVVGDGPGALACLENTQDIAIVLLDCQLPGIDGYEVARRIRQREASRGDGSSALPIIAISAATGDEHRMRAFDSGMDGTLAKPLRLEELGDLLALWVPVLAGEASAERPATLHEVFLQASLDDYHRLRTALHETDLDTARHRAHRLYGAALMVGAEHIARIGGNLERQLDTRGSPHSLSDIMGQPLEDLRLALREYAQSYGTSVNLE